MRKSTIVKNIKSYLNRQEKITFRNLYTTQLLQETLGFLEVGMGVSHGGVITQFTLEDNEAFALASLVENQYKLELQQVHPLEENLKRCENFYNLFMKNKGYSHKLKRENYEIKI